MLFLLLAELISEWCKPEWVADVAEDDGESDADEDDEDERTGEMIFVCAENFLLLLASLVLIRSKAFGFLFGKMQEINKSSNSW